MEILIDNPLATMYGPYFLIFFGSVIFFAVAVLAIVKSQFDRTDKLGVPAIAPNLDPFEIAYLRGGINEVVRSVIFSLTQKGYVEIDNSESRFYIKNSKTPPEPSHLSPIERAAFDWLGGAREPHELFSPYGLVSELETYGTYYQSRLEQQQMLTGDAHRAVLNPVKWSVYILILSLGGYKLFAAVANSNFNIIFLIVFTIAGLLVAGYVSKLPRVTKLGKAYLERLQTAFDNLKYTSQAGYLPTNQRQFAPQPKFAGVDPLLLSVGVFGGGILAGTVFDNYNQAFQRAQYSSAAGGSSCGSAGCGSSSSDSGGSSGDGGGSSCGGGCGGCGGGGD